MSYVFQFGTVCQEFDKPLLGTWLTVRLSAITMVLGLGVGILGALGKNAIPSHIVARLALHWRQ